MQKELIIKSAGLIANLNHVESVGMRFDLPYHHDGYLNSMLVVHFKDDEDECERASAMYLYSVARQQWELFEEERK